MGQILKKMRENRAGSGGTPATDVHIPDADELLAAHRAAQGLGPAPASPAPDAPPASPAPVSGPSGGLSQPPGGMLDTEEELLRRRRGGVQIN